MAVGAKIYVNFGEIPFTNDITVFSVKLRERANFSKMIDYFWTVELKAYVYFLDLMFVYCCLFDCWFSF
jgi:hypothetical protein